MSWASRVFGPLRVRLTVTLLVLLALFVANAVVVLLLARGRDHTRSTLETRLNPAEVAVERLLTSLVNQDSAALGYRLTLDTSFLDAYTDALGAEKRTSQQLRRLLAGRKAPLAAVDDVEQAAARWRSDIEVEMSQSRGGGLTQAQITTATLRGSVLFGDVRGRVAGLSGQVGQLQSQAVSAQANDDTWVVRAVIAQLILAGVVVLVGLLLLRRSLTRPLADLVAGIEAVGAGDLTRKVRGRGPREFIRVGEAVDAMRERMVRDAGETLNRSLILVTEQQRRQLAADIHDDPTQALTAVTLRLQRLRRRLTGRDAEMLAEAETAASAALQRLRQLIFELYSPTLDADGLVAALRAYLSEMFDEQATATELISNGDEDKLSPSIRALAYRLARSAIQNAAKHAEAQHVTVRVDFDRDRLSVEVADDGRGFDVREAQPNRPGHIGLPVSARFADSAGGGYVVDSMPGRGTTVRFWLPLVSDAA